MKEKFRRESFAHFINPVCLALGIIGFLLHFEVNFLNIGAIGIGAWGVINKFKNREEALDI